MGISMRYDIASLNVEMDTLYMVLLVPVTG